MLNHKHYFIIYQYVDSNVTIEVTTQAKTEIITTKPTTAKPGLNIQLLRIIYVIWAE